MLQVSMTGIGRGPNNKTFYLYVFERGESYDLYIFFHDGSLFNIGWEFFVWTTRIFLYIGKD